MAFTRLVDRACLRERDVLSDSNQAEFSALRRGNSEEFREFQGSSQNYLIAFAIAGYEPTGGIFLGIVTTFTSDYQIVDMKKWDNTHALVNILRKN